MSEPVDLTHIDFSYEASFLRVAGLKEEIAALLKDWHDPNDTVRITIFYLDDEGTYREMTREDYRAMAKDSDSVDREA